MVGKSSYKFGSVESLEKSARQIEETFEARKEKGEDDKVLCLVDDNEWLQDFDRAPLVVYENGEPVNAAAVSKHRRYYTPTQFHEPVMGLLEAIKNHDADVQVDGHIQIGEYSKRMTAKINFSRHNITDPTGSDVNLGMRIKTAHNGFHAVNVSVGAVRQVCSNGMVAWDSELEFSHAHDEGPFKETVMREALEAILSSETRVRERFEDAHEEKLSSKDEMFLLLLDCGFEWLFDDPMSTLRESFEAEKNFHDNPQQMESEPSLYDAYNVGTYAIDHLAPSGHSERAKESARERLSQLLESYSGDVPEADEMVAETVEERTDSLMNGEEQICDGERELVRSVAQAQ